MYHALRLADVTSMSTNVDILSDGTGIECSSTNIHLSTTTQPLNYINMYSRKVIYACIGYLALIKTM